MAMEGLPEVVPPSDRVPGQRLLAAPILKRQRRRYREEIGKKTSILGISSVGVIYRQRGQLMMRVEALLVGYPKWKVGCRTTASFP